MQNCTTVQCFMVHASYGVKAYQVHFLTQQTPCRLDFPIKSYDWLGGDYTEDHQPCEALRDFSSWRLLSYYHSRNSKVHSHLTRRVFHCILTLCISEIERDFENEIEPLLFSFVLTKFREWSLPCCSYYSLRGIAEAATSSAPNWCSYSLHGSRWLIVGYVGWFFENVVGRILDSCCRLKKVVGFEFYLLGGSSYHCLQQVI